MNKTDIAIKEISDLLDQLDWYPQDIYESEGQWFYASGKASILDSEITASTALGLIKDDAKRKIGKRFPGVKICQALKDKIERKKNEIKCLICERGLDPVSETSQEQPWEGGEVQVHFCYGSCKYDYIAFRDQVREPGYDQHILKIMKGEPSDWKPTQSKDGTTGSKPKNEMINHEDRDIRLASCLKIRSVICDDCFKAKSHLFRGYEKNADGKLELIVE